MSIDFTSDITIVSLILSVTAFGIVIYFVVRVSRMIQNMRTMNNNLDASALVTEFGERQKHLERRLIDEKVRLEILELRLSQQKQLQQSLVPVPKRREQRQDSVDPLILREFEGKGEFKILDDTRPKVLSDVTPESSSIDNDRKDALVGEILEFVLKGEGKMTARQIQQKIGRSREHTARTMNVLYKQGLVSRDLNVRPFTYSITPTGQKELSGGR